MGRVAAVDTVSQTQNRGGHRRAAVIGGGNAAQALAADLAHAGLAVAMLEHPARHSRLRGVARHGAIDIVRGGTRRRAPIELVTQDAHAAVATADLVVVAVPAFAHRTMAELVVPHLNEDATLLVFTASLGGLEFVEAARRSGRPLRGPVVEVENLPYTCRTAGENEVVIHLDVPSLSAAVYPAARTQEVGGRLASLFPALRFGRDLLEPLLTNMNGVVHPPVVLMSVPVMEAARGQPWWIWEVAVTPSVARMIECLDDERRAVGRAFGYELEPVAELMWRSGYGPRGTIYEAINGCAALRNVKGPPDLRHRWFTEDIPYTLALWADLSDSARVAAPIMAALCSLASGLLGKDVRSTGRRLADLGLGGLDPEALTTRLRSGEAR